MKIAFLFLTIDNPNFPDIWDFYFKDHQDKINIYIHPKYPDRVTWQKDKIINNLKETEWGFIVDAYKSLFRQSLLDKSNVKFITISESCVPIKPFKTKLFIFVPEPLYDKVLDGSKYKTKFKIVTPGFLNITEVGPEKLDILPNILTKWIYLSKNLYPRTSTSYKCKSNNINFIYRSRISTT